MNQIELKLRSLSFTSYFSFTHLFDELPQQGIDANIQICSVSDAELVEKQQLTYL